MKVKFKREKSTTTIGHYVKNADLYPAIVRAKEQGKVTDELIRMIYMIADRNSRKANFVKYSYREDMVMFAVQNLCKNALKFSLDRDNPFAYYTSAINNSFLQYLGQEKKERDVKDKAMMISGYNPSYNFESEDNQVSEAISDGLSGEQNEDLSETLSIEQLKESIRYRDRVPGECKTFGPGNYEIDPVTGAYITK